MSFGDNAQAKALLALIDIVEQIVQGLASPPGTVPHATPQFVEGVNEILDTHRRALRTEMSAWEEHSVAVSAIERIEGGDDIDPHPGPGSD